MLLHASFDYFIVRVVPEVARQEFINAGVVIYCPEKRYLGARVQVCDARLSALWPSIDVALVREHLLALERVCGGSADGGPIARLSLQARFHWLGSVRSTIIQPSPVHTGTCRDPEEVMDRLVKQFL